MNIAFCYESVLPTRGGCETYIADLARRLVADGHDVHLFACRWDEKALPRGMTFHAIEPLRGPRFLRPWRFARRCHEAMQQGRHDVTIGFDKTWGQDVLYPQGGLHSASADHNLKKYAHPLMRGLARLVKGVDLAHWSFKRLERRQYLGADQPLVVVNSYMVREHFQRYYGIAAERLHVVRSAIDPARFGETDRPRRRAEFRDEWGLAPTTTVGLMAAMNYRLKGLEPLLHAVRHLTERPEFREAKAPFCLVVAGSPHYQAYERLAQRLGISESVRFIGHCDPMKNAYFGADFLVHPTFYDPCSLVVLEALTCGLPVITTRYNGASELLTQGQEGYVVDDPHDHARLAWCLGQMLDPARRTACSQAARRAGQAWTFDLHYQELLGVLKLSVQKHNAA